jgi:lipoyl(octanoyl) transferase
MGMPLHVDLTGTGRLKPFKAIEKPEIRQTNRGGLTTYHGPGQLVLWPVIDMHSPLYPKFEVASYAEHLEATTQRLLEEVFGIATTTLHDEPGVWVVDPTPVNSDAPLPPVQRKIAALGVHHRRHVTGLGIAINVDIATSGDESVNPWARFVPCGLKDKQVTSIAAELGPQWRTRLNGDEAWDMEDLARRWASIFEAGLKDASLRGTNAWRGRASGSSEPEKKSNLPATLIVVAMLVILTIPYELYLSQPSQPTPVPTDH